MVLVCFKCSNNARTHPNLGYFSFPKDVHRCALWFAAIKANRLPKHTEEYCNKVLRLCSQHFREQDIYNTERGKRLVIDAVPISFNELEQNNELSIEEESAAGKSFIQEVVSQVHPRDILCVSESCSPSNEYSASTSQLSTPKYVELRKDASTITPLMLSSNSPCKVALRRKVKCLSQECRRRQHTNLREESTISLGESPTVSPKEVYL